MGASQFSTVARGKTASEAFKKAVEEARYDRGHAGYTGTIAEKREYKVLPVPEGKAPRDYANQLLDEDDRRISDKWGPAGCIQLSEGEYLFFGWASS